MPVGVLAWLARLLMLVAVLSGLIMQVLADEWLPPRDSVSQYANSPAHAAFVVALLALGLAAVVVALIAPRATRADRSGAALLVLAGCGFVLAAAVPAPPVGGTAPLNDVLHQAGGISGTFALTIGGALLSWLHRHSMPGRFLLAVASSSVVFLVLLTLVNFDIDVVGFGRRESWALHQSASLVCMVVVVALLPSVLDRRRAH